MSSTPMNYHFKQNQEQNCDSLFSLATSVISTADLAMVPVFNTAPSLLGSMTSDDCLAGIFDEVDDRFFGDEDVDLECTPAPRPVSPVLCQSPFSNNDHIFEVPPTTTSSSLCSAMNELTQATFNACVPNGVASSNNLLLPMSIRSHHNAQVLGLAQSPASAGERSSKKRHRVSNDWETTFAQQTPQNTALQGAAAGGDDDLRFHQHQTELWTTNYLELLNFAQRTGHCNVPNTNKTLVNWSKRQRHQYRLMKEGRPSTMTPDRVSKLSAIGFIWEVQTTLWFEKLVELKQFKEIHGHCNVPTNYPPNPALATWVKAQRRQKKLLNEGKPSNMNASRIEALEEIGFAWQLRRYKKAHTL